MKKFLVFLLCFLSMPATALDVNGQLKTAQLEQSTSDPVTNVVEGRIFWDSDDDIFRVRGGSAWLSVADLSTAQTFTNKFLTSPVINTSQTYANQAESRYAEQTGNGTNYVGFKAPDAVTANAIFKLPDGDGTTGQVLKTDGSKALGWASVVTNPMSNPGEMIYGASAGAPTAVAAGTAGQHLLSNGTSAPAFGWENFNTLSSAGYTFTNTDGYAGAYFTTSSSDRTATLPANSSNSKRVITIVKVDSGTGKVLVALNGSDTLAGNTVTTAYSLSAVGDYLIVKADGAGNWLVIGKGLQNRIQTKTVSGNVTTNTSFLTFSNLISGRFYCIYVTLSMQLNDTTLDRSLQASVTHNANTLLQLAPETGTSPTLAIRFAVAGSTCFTAAATTLTLDSASASSTSFILQDSTGGNGSSKVTLVEVNNSYIGSYF